TRNTLIGLVCHGTPSTLNAPVFTLDAGQIQAGAGLRFDADENDFLQNGTASPTNPYLSVPYPGNAPNTGFYVLIADGTNNPPQPPTDVRARIRRNTFTNNFWYGTAVGVRMNANGELPAPPNGFTFEGTYEENRYHGNGLNAAMFAFRQIPVSHGG